MSSHTLTFFSFCSRATSPDNWASLDGRGDAADGPLDASYSLSDSQEEVASGMPVVGLIATGEDGALVVDVPRTAPASCSVVCLFLGGDPWWTSRTRVRLDEANVRVLGSYSAFQVEGLVAAPSLVLAPPVHSPPSPSLFANVPGSAPSPPRPPLTLSPPMLLATAVASRMAPARAGAAGKSFSCSFSMGVAADAAESGKGWAIRSSLNTRQLHGDRAFV